MYYVMQMDRERDNVARVEDVDDIPGFPFITFTRGEKITDALPVIKYVLDAKSKGPLTDWLDTPREMVISDAFKEVLDKVGVKNIQYFPAVIIDKKKKKKYENYFQANIVGTVDCLDEAKSTITYFSTEIPGRRRRILTMDEMIIDESKLGDALVTRMETPIGNILAHEKVKKAAEAAGLTNVSFIPAQGYVYP